MFVASSTRRCSAEARVCRWRSSCNLDLDKYREAWDSNRNEKDDAADAGLSLFVCVQIVDNDWRIRGLFDVTYVSLILSSMLSNLEGKHISAEAREAGTQHMYVIVITSGKARLSSDNNANSISLSLFD